MDRLHWLWPGREFRLPTFAPAPLEFDSDGAGSDSLLLDDVVTRIGPAASSQTARETLVPTPGELQARVERHLRDSRAAAAGADAANELRDALAELRRSVR